MNTVCVYFKVWPRHLFISELAEQIYGHHFEERDLWEFV